MKICSRCKKYLSFENFSTSKSTKDGFQYVCKDCQKQYRQNHLQEAYNYNKKYRKDFEKEIKFQKKQYYMENRENIKEKSKKYRNINKQKINKYFIYHRKENINYRISYNLRNRLYQALKNNQKIGSAIDDLGCSIDELKQWLEQQFQPEMTWDNYGKGINSWNIDHIIPLTKVNLTNPKEFKKVNHWFNLRPIWYLENISKGNKI